MTSVKLKYNIASFSNLRVNFWAIPKCGNTTLKHTLIRANDPKLFERLQKKNKTNNDIEQWVHQTGACKYLSPAQANSNGYTNFTVVRDPVDRFVSGYRDFTQKRPTHNMVGSKYFVSEFSKLRKNPSEDLLLEILQNTTDDERDMHFKSQRHFCKLAENIIVLPLSTIELSIKSVLPNVDINEHLHRTPPTPYLRTMLNVHIMDLYKADVQMNQNAMLNQPPYTQR